MSEVDSTVSESTEPPEKPRLGLRLVGIALILPVISGILLCFVTSFSMAIGLSLITVFVTAALVAIDASRLGEVDLNGRQREGAGMLFVGMCLLWIVVYPFAFFRRSAFGSPDLGWVSLLVAVSFVAAPLIVSVVNPPLPSCTSTEVVQLLEEVIRNTPMGATTRSIDGHRELSYDRSANVRHGECVAHTDTGDIPIKFIVEWLDSRKAMFQVRLSEPDLPSCTSSEVAQLLEEVIRGTPLGATTKSIDGHRELSYDRNANRRRGECVAHTDAGEIAVEFIVEWQDREKGLFQVLIPEPDLPLCTSREVVQILEEVIRSTPLGATTKSIGGHRELSYDRRANVRHGECVAHTDAGDIPVKFNVEWQDRKKGMIQVLILTADLPPCTSKEVLRILEEIIRSTPVGATTKSIDGLREVSYDRSTNVRYGKCVAHTDSGNIPIDFVVEWQDQEKGLYQVRIFESPD